MSGGDWVRRLHDGRLICLMPLQSLTEVERSQVPVSDMSSVTQKNVEVINDKLKQKWGAITALSAYTVGSNKMQLLETFLKVDYFPTLAAALRAVRANDVLLRSVFVAAYDVNEGNPDPATLQARLRLVSSCIKEDGAVVEKNLAKAWEEKKAAMAPSLQRRIPDNAYAQFHRAEYFHELQKVVFQRTEDAKSGAAKIQKLLIPYETNASAEIVSSRQALVAAMSQADIDRVNDMMQAKWNSEVAKAPDMLRDALPAKVPEDYLMDHYFEDMFAEFGHKVQAFLGEGHSSAGASSKAQAALGAAKQVSADQSLGEEGFAFGMSHVLAQGLSQVEAVAVETQETM